MMYTFGKVRGVHSDAYFDDELVNNLLPKRIEYFAKNGIKIKKCVSGKRDSAAISEEGDLWVFGYDIGYNWSGPSKVSLPQNTAAWKVAMGNVDNYVIVQKRN